MQTFREWLREQETILYTKETFENDINIFDKAIKMVQTHEYSLNNKLPEYINEKVIEPEQIIINSLDLDILNKEFNKYKIFFHKDVKLSGVYDFKTDKIIIGVSVNDDKKEIEAMIGHELVHKEQHKRSNGNFFKLTETMVIELRELIDKRNYYLSKPNGNLVYKNELIKLDKLFKQKDLEYKHLNPFEEMAYAYQSVKTYAKILNSPQEIIELLLYTKFPVTKRLKKYISMYWLIKDKI
jgi:hypothetical protein